MDSGTLRWSAANQASAGLVCGRNRARVDAEQRPDLDLPIPTMTTWRPDTADTARCGPPGDGLGINAEEGCDLSGSKQAITLPVHLRLLARLETPLTHSLS